MTKKWLNKYNDSPNAQNGIEGTMGGLTDVGFNYNGAWGGTMAMGGSLPGSVGFTYARTQSPAPSNGKYAKKTKASAQNGTTASPSELKPATDTWQDDLRYYYNKITHSQPIEQIGQIGPLIKAFDPTGVTNYPDFYKAVESGKGDQMFMEGLASLPLIGKAGKYVNMLDKAIKSKRTGVPFFKAGRIIASGLSTAKDVGEIRKKEFGGDIIAQNGQEMKYYQEGLDWKPKSISRDGGWLSKYEEGGVIEDDMGQWAHPGEITKINSNQITMQGVDYPVLGISDTGDTQMMQPGQEYKFKGKSVTEIPMMKDGGWLDKFQEGGEKTYGTYRLPEVVVTAKAPEKGFWDQSISSFLNENKDAGLLGALSSVVTYPLGLPQQAMMYGLTGKVQRPSEALNINNRLGAFATDVVADPTNLLGVGLADDALKLKRAGKLFSEGRMSQATPKASLLGDLKESFTDLKSIGKEAYGYLKNDKANKQAIAEGNQWLQNWIQNPSTQAKIEKDLDFIKNRSNALRDVHDLGYEQAKTFTPIAKEFPISRQLNEGAMHSNNMGVSYIHDYDPYQRINSNIMNDPYAGSWISRDPKISPAERTLTTIHEGTHDWTSDWLLNESGQKDYLLSELDPKGRSDWEIWRNNPKKFEKDFGKKAAYQAYLADPTEQHARIMELRKYFNLTPEQTITPGDAEDMISKLKSIPRRKQPIDVSGFLNKIDNDPKKLSDRFNRLWATSPYIAPIAGAATMATQKEQKNGGWLNKYE